MHFSGHRKIVIVGNGPSLRGLDLRLFRGIPSLGMNAAYRHWHKIGWYPTIYANLDDQVVLTHQDEIRRLHDESECQIFFLHPNILDAHPDLASSSRVFFISSFLRGRAHREYCEKFGLPTYSSDYFKSSRPQAMTTGSHSVRFAAQMGFTDFLLVGIDCKYVEVLPEAKHVEGLVLEMAETPAENPNYFFSDYQQKGDRYNIPNPAAGDPQLHLNAFKALRKDNEERGFNLNIAVGTEGGALTEEGLFPSVSPTSFIGRRLDAVFVPLRVSDIDSAARTVDTWSEFHQLPTARSEAAVDLCFAFNNEPPKAELEKIVAAFGRLNERALQFKNLRFFSSFLSGFDDLYVRDGSKPPVGPEGYSAGPNNQHFDIIFRFCTGYSHIHVLELDCYPIRPFWLDRLQDLVGESKDFWIAGAGYDGAGAPRAFYQFNGNALYNIGDREFLRFYQQHLLSHFYRRAAAGANLTYDVIPYDLLAELFRGRGSEDLYRLWQIMFRKFMPSDHIVNVSMKADRVKLGGVGLAELRQRFPNACLVHGIQR